MVYKAIIDIGGYKVGETVPDEKAEVWLKMYLVPHVCKVVDVVDNKVVEVHKVEKVHEEKHESIEKPKREYFGLKKSR